MLPKASGKTENNTSVAVSIKADESFYIDKTKVSKSNLENELKNRFAVGEKKTLVIRGDQEVPYHQIVFVMDIANRNKMKMILAVKGQ